jgi:alkylation response protein AidB-like acyl-CoA dehydrogenase
MVAKRQAVTGAVRVVEAAMEALGGGTYFTSSPMSRLWRDVRAGTFHPLTPEATLTYAGRLALGGDGASE